MSSPALLPNLRFALRREHLATHLGCSVEELDSLRAMVTAGHGYVYADMRVKGKTRRVFIPSHEGLKVVQRRLLRLLQEHEHLLPECVHGYVRGRSNLSNAQAHVGNLWQQRFDVADFFASVTVNHVERGLAHIGLKAELHPAVVGLLTRGGSLPLGARTSPVIANFALIDLDEALTQVAARHGLVFTRYSDDLTFSGRQAFDVAAEVSSAVTDFGLVLNDSKTRSAHHGQDLYVTGLSTSEPDRPRLPKERKRQWRAQCHIVEKYGLGALADDEGISETYMGRIMIGRLIYAGHVEPAFKAQLRKAYPKAFEEIFGTPSKPDPDKPRVQAQAAAERVRRLGTRASLSYVPLHRYPHA